MAIDPVPERSTWGNPLGTERRLHIYPRIHAQYQDQLPTADPTYVDLRDKTIHSYNERLKLEFGSRDTITQEEKSKNKDRGQQVKEMPVNHGIKQSLKWPRVNPITGGTGRHQNRPTKTQNNNLDQAMFTKVTCNSIVKKKKRYSKR